MIGGKTDHINARASALIAAMPGVRVACLGLAFKANIDDFRESPAPRIACALADMFGSRIRIVEPDARVLPPPLTIRAWS